MYRLANSYCIRGGKYHTHDSSILKYTHPTSITGFDVSMHGKQLNFCANSEVPGRRLVGKSESGRLPDKDDGSADASTAKISKLAPDRGFASLVNPRGRTAGLPFEEGTVVLALPSRRQCLWVLQASVVVAVAVEMASTGLSVQDVLRRAGVVILVAVVGLERMLHFHVCIVVLLAQVGTAAPHATVAPATLVGVLVVTLHRCITQGLRTWLNSLLALTTVSVLLSTILLGQLVPEKQLLAELLMLGITVAVYAVLEAHTGTAK